MKIKYIVACTVLFAVSYLNGITAQNDKTTPSLYKSADTEKMRHWVDSVYDQMDTGERVGQLFMPVVLSSDTETNRRTILSLVKKQHIGGILFSKSTPLDQATLTNIAQEEAKVPLMISLDGEWGLSMRLSNTTRFPRNMMLGAIQNDSLLYYYGQEVARQCRLMGIHINFAPVLDVNSNPSNPVIGNRSFGENPERIAQQGIMYSKGLEDGGVLAVAKHFPGHGDTSTDSHKVLPLVSHNRERLDSVELKTFREYINAGLSGMMIAHLNVPALDKKNQPSSLSKTITTDLLQDELGFSGLIFTDGLQMKGVSDEDDYCVRALLAGNDILLGPVSTVREYEAVKKAVEDNIISEEQLKTKCKKILAYKYILGINNTQPINTQNLTANLNTSHADWLNSELNKNAITLLKDDQKIIPLKELDKRKIAAVSIGEAADNSFHKALKLYANVTCFNVADNAGLLKLKKALESFNTIIVSIHSTKTRDDAAIQSVTQGKETILSFFVVPYRMSSYSASIKDAEAVILAYEGSDLAQNYAAQAIFGGTNINGKIPVTVKGLFNQGDGISAKKNRLGYELPESVDIASYRLKGIDTIVYEGIKAKAFPGCQVLIAKDGVIIYNRSFGSFEYGNSKNVTDSDLYDIASMTKASATVPAIMKLYDEGKMKLSSPLSAYVSPLKGTDKSQITVREALYHETGLPAYIPYYSNSIDKNSYTGNLFSRRRTTTHTLQFDGNTWAQRYKFKPSLVSTTTKTGFLPLADDLFVNKAYKDTIVASIAESKLRKRKSYLYSCLNFMLLKEAVESISKTDLNTFTQDNLYKKLGASTTTYNPLDKFKKSRIAPTEKDDFLRKEVLQGHVHDEGAAFAGGINGNAGLFSSANDLAKIYQMLLNNGKYGGEEYISEKTCFLFTKTKSANSRRGLGFDKPETRTNKSSPTSPSTPASAYGHTGFTGTCFWIDPDNNLIYIFLSNRVYPKRTQRDLTSLKIRERIQEEIYKAMKKDKSLDELKGIDTSILIDDNANTNINTETNDDDPTDAE